MNDQKPCIKNQSSKSIYSRYNQRKMIFWLLGDLRPWDQFYNPSNKIISNCIIFSFIIYLLYLNISFISIKSKNHNMKPQIILFWGQILWFRNYNNLFFGYICVLCIWMKFHAKKSVIIFYWKYEHLNYHSKKWAIFIQMWIKSC